MAAAASAAGFTHSATADVTYLLLEQRNHHLLFFLSFYRTHVHLADVTLIDDDMKSILTGDTKDAPGGQIFSANASGATWWPNFFANTSGATWWPNFQLIQVAPPSGQSSS